MVMPCGEIVGGSFACSSPEEVEKVKFLDFRFCVGEGLGDLVKIFIGMGGGNGGSYKILVRGDAGGDGNDREYAFLQ